MAVRVERNSGLVACILRQCLAEGRAVEVDGLGIFRPSAGGGYEFAAPGEPKVFIAYVQEDLPAAERLYAEFAAQGFDPWLDRKKLLPGQNWPRAIERAIEISDFFVACFSSRSVGQRGQFQSELRYALDCASCMPLDRIFLVPVRLNACPVPLLVKREIQYVDLFPDWSEGFHRIVSAMGKYRRIRPKDELRLTG